MKVMTLAGKFRELELLEETANSLSDGEHLQIRIGSCPPAAADPCLDQNAYHSLVFAAELLKREAGARKTFHVEIVYV